MSLKTVVSDAISYLSPQEVDCIVYHSPCADGSGAAFSAWLKHGKTAKYLPLSHQSSTDFDLEQLSGRKVVFLDCSLNKEQIILARSIANKVMVLDHHASGQALLAGVEGCFFVMSNSGAILAWHYFHGLDSTPPSILRLIEDRDLLRWQERERSEPLAFALTKLYPGYPFKSYVKYLDENNLRVLISEGKQIIVEHKVKIKRLSDNAKRCKLKREFFSVSYDVMCVQMPSYDLTVEVAEFIYNNHDIDFVLLWHELADKRYRVSFRTNRGVIDLSKIASRLGGGGHAKKAGVVLNSHPTLLFEPSSQ